MLRGVIFDLGSTLLYSEHDHHWNAILPRMRADLLAHLQDAGYALDGPDFLNRMSAKFAEFDRQRQNDWVEYTTEWILKTTLEEMGAPLPPPQLVESALKAYYAYSETFWRPMPGLHETLQALAARGLRLAVISNASDAANIHRLMDRAGLRHYFDPVLISAAVGIRKPNPKIFEMVLTRWGLAPGECLMVGDTLGADILGAQMAGLHNVWLTSHANHPANQAHRGTIIPEAEIAAFSELPALLEKWPVE